jgi:hypothetical protein
MPKFRKKPVVIEAWQWGGEKAGEMPGVCQCDTNSVPHLHTAHENSFRDGKGQIVFLTVGDWIIPEAKKEGRYYPCKPDVFAETYEPASPPIMAELTPEMEALRQVHEMASPGHITWHLPWQLPTEAPILSTKGIDIKSEDKAVRVLGEHLPNGKWRIDSIEELPPGALGEDDPIAAPLDYRGERIGKGKPIGEDHPAHPMARYSRFSTALEILINSHSMENASDTPDFLLAAFLVETLQAWDRAVSRRSEWYGGSDQANRKIEHLEAQVQAEGEHTAAANAEIDKLRDQVIQLSQRLADKEL